MGNMERGFFFFSKFKSGNTHRQTFTVTYKNAPTPNFIKQLQLNVFFKFKYIPGLSLLFMALEDFLWISKVAETNFRIKVGCTLKKVPKTVLFFKSVATVSYSVTWWRYRTVC